jgi:hypothetical protein
MTTPRLWGYVADFALPVDEQRALLDGISVRLGIPIHAVLEEHAADVYVRWNQRPVMRELIDGVGPDDHLMLADAWLAVFCVAEMPRFFDHFLVSAKAHVHVADFGGLPIDIDPSSGRLFVQLLRGMLDVIETSRAEQARWNKALGRNGGLKHGFRMMKTKYGYQSVLDPEQVAIVREIYRRREAGESFTEIMEDFRKRDLRTSDGKPWATRTQHNRRVQNSSARIRSAYKAYKALLEKGEDLSPWVGRNERCP